MSGGSLISTQVLGCIKPAKQAIESKTVSGLSPRSLFPPLLPGSYLSFLPQWSVTYKLNGNTALQGAFR